MSKKHQATLSYFFKPSNKKSVSPKTENNKTYSTESVPTDSNKSNSDRLNQFKHGNDGTPIIDTSLRTKFSQELVKQKRVREVVATEDEFENNNIIFKKRSSKKPKASKYTPLENQVIQFKEKHPDKILAIQVGYKYKFFLQDAVIASKILNIMLIPGQTSLDDTGSAHFERLAYCSIPDVRLKIHLKRLLNNGLKVGIIEQLETGAIKAFSDNKSSIFERKLTGVYTSATYFDDEDDVLASHSSTGEYICCLVDGLKNENEIVLVAVSPITGDVCYDTFKDDFVRSELETRLLYLEPSEVLHVGELSKESSIKLNSMKCKVMSLSKKTSYDQELVALINRLHFTRKFHRTVQICILELINYLKEFNLSDAFDIEENYNSFDDSNHMTLNSNTVKNLEIFKNQTDNSEKGSLIWLLDHTRTQFGYRLLRKWVSKPLLNRELIEHRLEAISDIKLKYNHYTESLMNSISKMPDLEKGLIKIHYKKVKRKEIYLLLKGFNDILRVCKNFNDFDIDTNYSSPLMRDILKDLKNCSNDNVIENFIEMISISDAVDEKDLTSQKKNFFNVNNHTWIKIEEAKKRIEDTEQNLQKELQEIKKLLKRPAMEYTTNSKETHLIEIRNTMVKNLPKEWVKISGTKTVSRFRSPQVSNLHAELQYHNDLLINACDDSFNEFLSMVSSNYHYLNKIVKSLAQFDCILSLAASTSASINYTKPELVDMPTIEIKEGRNPIIEQLATTNYVPNDVFMTHLENRCLIITGPNMGGKSSYVRQIALIIIMAQIGCYVPASFAKISIFDSILTRMGANDDLIKGESTFKVEMNECSNIIKHATDKSLVILDEIGRGTGTTDGIAIAYSILDYFLTTKKSPLTLFITHYPSLHVFENKYSKLVKNCHMNYIEEKVEGQSWPVITFLYNVVDGVVNNSYGLNVARLASIPNDIIDKAFQTSNDLKKEIEESYSQKWAWRTLKTIGSLLDNSGDGDDSLVESLRNIDGD